MAIYILSQTSASFARLGWAERLEKIAKALPIAESYPGSLQRSFPATMPAVAKWRCNKPNTHEQPAFHWSQVPCAEIAPS